MTKYVVSGYIGFDNFGDEAIAKVLVDRLKHEGAEKITLISSNPEKTAKLYRQRARNEAVETMTNIAYLKDK